MDRTRIFADLREKIEMNKPDRPQSVLGIDLGSRNVKLALMENSEIVSTNAFDTVDFYKKYGFRAESGFRVNLAALGFGAVEHTVATGYGRMAAAIEGADTISEISAHFLGAVYQTGLMDFTLLDIGGQDFKIIKAERGELLDFVTNDKCAASSGRYLENMAHVLGVSLQEIGSHYEHPVSLSNTCAIFSESELIGLIVMGEPLSSLAAGINKSVVERFLPFLSRFGDGLIVLSGGVALNRSVVRLMGEMTGREVLVVDDPVHNGAIGCCVSGEGE